MQTWRWIVVAIVNVLVTIPAAAQERGGQRAGGGAERPRDGDSPADPDAAPCGSVALLSISIGAIPRSS